jgi:mannose-6-phosphate isomerase-like protein (cupin superfamily)
MMFKIMNLKDTPSEPMDGGRGTKVKLINTTLGTHNVDVHLNTLNPGGPRGKVHRHTRADNVYIVKRGVGTLTVEDKTYTVREDDIIFIPADMKHSLSNLSDDVFQIFEIYAPAGKHFDFVLAE